jgi:hypothetical protein
MGILTDETEKLIEEQASRRGETPDALVRRLLGEPGDLPRPKIDWAKVDSIVEKVANLPVLDNRPLKEVRDSLWE